MPAPTVFWSVGANPMAITIGNGLGGVQSYSLPNCGSITNDGFTVASNYYQQVWLLSYLNNIWGSTVGKSLGAKEAAVTGSGSGSFGIV